jgi:DNA-binding beta-propeller fold protein YncE
MLPRLFLLGWILFTTTLAGALSAGPVERRLYVAVPGIRNYLEYGGHGILVMDPDHGYRCLRRIPGAGLDARGVPMNVKGIVANAATQRLYVSTLQSLACYDLRTDRLLWERSYTGGCDRPAITPDGKLLFLPSLESTHWNVVSAEGGEILRSLGGHQAAHNTLVSLDGARAFLADRHSARLTVVDVAGQREIATVGPFLSFIRPFTVNGARSRVYVCVDDLLGFEVGDINTGKPLHRVTVSGYAKGPIKRHGCPSHGIGLTPDEREIWLTDGANERLHVFDNTVEPPRQVASVRLRDQPGWVTFSLDGTHAWVSTGDVVDVATRKGVTTLSDENGAPVQSEKMVEVQFQDGRVVRVGDQFGIGRVRPSG